MKLKVCGMKYGENIQAVSQLHPDYMGFIFYDQSARYFDGDIPEISESIKKVGVFVNASLDEIISKINTYQLQAIQLHGDESPDLCKALNHQFHQLEIIKVFSISNQFDFKKLQPYETYVDAFLFDTKGKLPGGNGYTFDWNALEGYPSEKPFILSGGIGLDEAPQLKTFLKSPLSKHCLAVDVNSQFEIEPGLKNVQKLKEFKSEL
ncbi:phosphoribosylanthranilate isomerase [Mangrovimonas sp. AS39]|uniref:phosphoribosylanthranilate isomerase n=1 Tax=Mangrovimonas futianensis TaxID=2895523 RepID=UPI001E2FDD3E|nr:phosphoribosylanthranilate isomerase [Mangrovimonas futianensis]MCF1191452.1 phosphoribosylanthranilate isomerase [Mangrovimonas futianensis]MCF1195147.1 phosphoribosylanthranilate isomerase [Mangrovimonas futianensis]